MSENQNKGTGKFFLGAALGALAGAIAGKFINKHQDEIDEKMGEFKDNMISAKDQAKDKAEEIGGKIADAGKAAKNQAARHAQMQCATPKWLLPRRKRLLLRLKTRPKKH